MSGDGPRGSYCRLAACLGSRDGLTGGNRTLHRHSFRTAWQLGVSQGFPFPFGHMRHAPRIDGRRAQRSRKCRDISPQLTRTVAAVMLLFGYEGHQKGITRVSVLPRGFGSDRPIAGAAGVQDGFYRDRPTARVRAAGGARARAADGGLGGVMAGLLGALTLFASVAAAFGYALQLAVAFSSPYEVTSRREFWVRVLPFFYPIREVLRFYRELES